MSKGLRIATVMIGCLMLCLGAHAEAPKYSFAQLSYAFIDIDEDDFDKGSGGAISGSYGFDNFQVFGGWGTSTLDFKYESMSTDATMTESVDTTEWVVGGGWQPLTCLEWSCRPGRAIRVVPRSPPSSLAKGFFV